MRNCQRTKRDVTSRECIGLFILMNIALFGFFVKFHRDKFNLLLERTKSKLRFENGQIGHSGLERGQIHNGDTERLACQQIRYKQHQSDYIE